MVYRSSLIIAILWITALCGHAVALDHIVWYEKLLKPAFAPSVCLLSFAWPFLYTILAISAVVVTRRSRDTKLKKSALLIFTTHFIVAILWPPLTFGCESVNIGLLWIILLNLLGLANFIVFVRLQTISGLLFVPYIIWIFFSTIFMQNIWLINP